MSYDPDNVFVAGFIGSPKMNFLSAKAVSSKGKTLTVELPDRINGKTDDLVRVQMQVRWSRLSFGPCPLPGNHLQFWRKLHHIHIRRTHINRNDGTRWTCHASGQALTGRMVEQVDGIGFRRHGHLLTR